MAKESLVETETAYRSFKKEIKEELTNYTEAQKRLRKLRHDVWRKKSVVDGCQRAIACFPIVPIIIPTPIDIN